METYKELYYFLFNQITDIIDQLKSINVNIRMSKNCG